MMLAIGFLGPRKHHDQTLDDFHLASRSLRGTLLVGTFCATILGASATLGMAGLGFSRGLPGAWWMLSGTIGLIALSVFFAQKIRATGCKTLPDLVGTFYDQNTRLAASVLIAISWIAVIAVQIVASGKILSAVFIGNESLFMVISTAIFVLYTALGGQKTVVRTDLVQFVIIIIGILLLFYIGLSAAGPGVLFEQDFPTSEKMTSMDVISMILVVGSAYLVGPDMYSRLLSSYSPKEARRSSMISAIILIPLAFLITSLGVFAAHLYPNISPEQSVTALMTGLVSPTAIGLIASAFLAAFMSSADTSLMTATSIIVFDLYGKIRPNASQIDLMRLSKMCIFVIGGLALLLAISSPSIIKTLMMAYTIFTGGLLVPVLAGFYRERLGLTPWGALIALLGGGITAMLLGQKYPLLGMIVSAILLFSMSWMDRHRFYGITEKT
ncbi:MAG: sodium:solute symporter family protein [Methanotrichaceae archaeon]|nr:sodium:solute symporter family protein [Methanotrichaceae archaeon]